MNRCGILIEMIITRKICSRNASVNTGTTLGVNSSEKDERILKKMMILELLTEGFRVFFFFFLYFWFFKFNKKLTLLTTAQIVILVALFFFSFFVFF